MTALDTLGCSNAHLHTSRELLGANISIYHKIHTELGVNEVYTPATDRGFLAGVALGQKHRRRIFSENRSAMHNFFPGSIYVRNFADEYKAELDPFEFLLLEIPVASLLHTAEDAGVRPVPGLRCEPGHFDPVLHHLAQALVVVLDRQDKTDALFVDQVATSAQTYLISKFGVAFASAPMRPLLSQSQELRAKELLRANLSGDILVAEIADACGLSRSYFIRAFRQTTGFTPHQWLTAQRIEQARTMLAVGAKPLAQISAACGFADQSHFTRVFAKATGSTPGIWRREQTGGR